MKYLMQNIMRAKLKLLSMQVNQAMLPLQPTWLVVVPILS